VKSVGIGKIKDRLFERGHLVVHLVWLDMRLELSEVIDSALAVGCGNHIGWVLADISSDLAPGCFDSCDRVGEGTILDKSMSE
jgi:hypothetical protein